ncbi:MAG: iron ABC transporter permease [Firmicutes bacterium]|nr:iron ABC transporter permease [Bacillota bacterium]
MGKPGVQAESPMSYGRFEVWLRKNRKRILAPHYILGLVLLLILAYLVVAPLWTLLRTTATWQPPDVRIRTEDVVVGEFTTYHWRRILNSNLSKAALWDPLWHTLTVAAGTVVLVIVIGGLLAWLVTRTDLPMRKFISNLAVLPYVLPSWTIALAWVQVFQNSKMYMPAGFLEYFTGITVPEWLVFGPVPIIIAMGLHYYPFAFLLISGALSSIDSQLEESGEVLGASRLKIMRRITFPIVLPALTSAVLLAFARSIGTFGTPAILGLPARYTVISTQIYSFLGTGRDSQGYILAIILMLMSFVGLGLNYKLIGSRKSYTTIGGKGTKHNLVKLGKWRTPITVVVVLFLLLVAVFPLLLIAYSSVMLNMGNFSLSNFSLHYWIGESTRAYADGAPGILRNVEVLGALKNSVSLSVIGGLLTGVVGMCIGYVVVKERGKWLSQSLEQLSFVPMLIPSIVFGSIYLALFSRPNWFIPSLYGTFALLVIVTVGKQLPYTARSGVSAMLQVSGDLEEAAVIQGVPWWKRFVKIMFPLTRNGFVAGALIVLITSMRELSLYILLATPANRVLTSITYRFIEEGNKQITYAITVLLIITVLTLTTIVNKWQKTDLASGIGGR